MTEEERVAEPALGAEEDVDAAARDPGAGEGVPEPVLSEAEAEAIAQAVLDEIQPGGEVEMTLEELATMGLAESVLWVVRALDLDPMLHSDPLVRHVASKLASSLSLRVERKNLGPQFHST